LKTIFEIVHPTGELVELRPIDLVVGGVRVANMVIGKNKSDDEESQEAFFLRLVTSSAGIAVR